MRYNGVTVAVSLFICLVASGDSGLVIPGESSPDRTGFQVLRLETRNDELVDRALQLAEEYEVCFFPLYVAIFCHKIFRLSTSQTLSKLSLTHYRRSKTNGLS